jgi:uncharacterized protein HemX
MDVSKIEIISKQLSDDESSLGSDGLDGLSLTGSSRTFLDNTPEPVQPQLAQKESQRVKYSKALVALVLLAATAVVGFFTYTLTRQQEEDAFVTQVRVEKFLLDFKALGQANTLCFLFDVLV